MVALSTLKPYFGVSRASISAGSSASTRGAGDPRGSRRRRCAIGRGAGALQAAVASDPRGDTRYTRGDGWSDYTTVDYRTVYTWPIFSFAVYKEALYIERAPPRGPCVATLYSSKLPRRQRWRQRRRRGGGSGGDIQRWRRRSRRWSLHRCTRCSRRARCPSRRRSACSRPWWPAGAMM